MRRHWFAWLAFALVVAAACYLGFSTALAADPDVVVPPGEKKPPELAKGEKEKDEVLDTGIQRTIERFADIIGWLQPKRKELQKEMAAALKAQNVADTARLKPEVDRYDMYLRALIRLRRQINEASAEGDLAKFKTVKTQADRLLDLFDAWRTAVKEQAKPRVIERAERAVVAYIHKLKLDAPPQPGELPDDIDNAIDSGAYGDPAKVRQAIEQFRKSFRPRGRVR